MTALATPRTAKDFFHSIRSPEVGCLKLTEKRPEHIAPASAGRLAPEYWANMPSGHFFVNHHVSPIPRSLPETARPGWFRRPILVTPIVFTRLQAPSKRTF